MILKNNKIYASALLFCSIIILSTYNCCCQKREVNIVNIQGYSHFNEGEEVRISSVGDYISMRPVTIAKCVIDKDGSFFLSNIKINTTKLVSIEYRNVKTDLFIEPDKNYRFFIDIDTMCLTILSPSSYGCFLQIYNESKDTLELNWKISKFKTILNQQIKEQGYSLLRNPKNSYNTIHKYITDKFELNYSPLNFYASYTYYSFSDLDLLFFKHNADTIYKKYFDNEYILYNNPAYMNLFKEFYHNYLYTSPRISKTILAKYINDDANYNALFNAVGKDRYLINERIRELVIIESLYSFSQSSEFNHINTLKLLNHIYNNTNFIEHKQIIENVIYMLNRYNGTTPTIPENNFKNSNLEEDNFDNYKGKYLYIHFFNSDCLDCIRDMVILKDLYKAYSDSLTVISVSLDFNYHYFKQFTYEHSDFKWVFFHFNNNFEWLKDIELSALPDNLLIDPNGNICNRFPPDPSKNLTNFFKSKFGE